MKNYINPAKWNVLDLPQSYLSRYCHADDLTESRVVDAIKPGYFTRGNITASLWHYSYTSLSIRSGKGIDVVNKGRFRCYFKITNDTVTLKEKQTLMKTKERSSNNKSHLKPDLTLPHKTLPIHATNLST